MLEWKKIAEQTYELIVPGGRLIRYSPVFSDGGLAMVFIPDQNRANSKDEAM